MIYACDACRYLFSADREIKQCPDCGKFKVRQANSKEIAEYERYRVEFNDYYDGSSNQALVDVHLHTICNK